MTALRPVEHADLTNFQFLARPAFSPDGTAIAYAVSRANLEKDGYDTNLWLYDLKNSSNVQLTFSGAEKAFRWSADGQSLLFVSARNEKEENKGKTSEIFRLPVRGGEAESLGVVPQPVCGLWELEGGCFLVLAHYTPEFSNPENARYQVFTQIPFTTNGEGFTGQRRTALALWNPATGELKRLSGEHMDVERCELSEDRKKVLFVALDYTDVMPMHNHVWEMNLSDGSMVCLSEGLEYSFKEAHWTGSSVIVAASDRKTYGINENPKLFTLERGAMKCLTPDLDSDMHNALVCDSRFGLASQVFEVDSGCTYYLSTDGYVCRLHRIGAGSDDTVVSPSLASVDNFDCAGGKVAAVGFKGLELQELYLIEDGKEIQLTHMNDGFMSGLDLVQPQHFQFDNGEGLMLDGWYMKPLHAQEGRRYPTIFHIHGGPKGAFGGHYFHEMQCWAARGFAVIYTNPRGSDGRGNEFADIREYYGIKDYSDFTAFIDWCCANLSFIDPENMGVTGGSYGGYMTNWIVTHTDRFKAAVTQRSICNWISMTGCSDIGYYFDENETGGAPWGSVEKAWNASPLKYITNAKT
ncbi:MAG: S9 family peptidase, partial [Pyramidobacter sp.]|nr:S9 family peptidase [Pyramidobacter sp.]